MAVACSKKSGTDCAADANCISSAGECTMSKSVEKELQSGILKVMKDKCGDLAGAFSDECIFHDTEAKCKNDQNCNWDTPFGGNLEPNEAGTKCVQPQGSCRKKSQSGGTASMDAMIKSFCPGVESTVDLQTACATRPSTEQLSCSVEKCPVMGLFMGAMLCAGGQTQDACTTLGDTCTWNGACTANTEALLDKIVPKDCPLRSTLGGGSSGIDVAQMTQTCNRLSTEEKCGDAGAACKFVTFKDCERAGDEPITRSACTYNPSLQAGQQVAQLLEPVGVQLQQCSKSKTQIACEATPKVPVKAGLGTGTSVSMDGALTIGVIVSLMMYS